ncbi:hypothetical protein DFA_03756 [Cavenderia fasciculata]|uniref:Ankyrin repeat-containing protein n=1 Tax=Cavenderia fasciculata TaxID=261658 RepID=F4Q0B3_CACFS|nr:uncharacterized protein DFA_03756 [Cavenderia fasciculata]EGG18264.1 hypothetical protein DFA_03756 [Cavenderia fasciculata]|eukprot:XP_004357087.1 hypothetical protein DFA_03756 [Cavenderia fasciculata]
MEIQLYRNVFKNVILKRQISYHVHCNHSKFSCGIRQDNEFDPNQLVRLNRYDLINSKFMYIIFPATLIEKRKSNSSNSSSNSSSSSTISFFEEEGNMANNNFYYHWSVSTLIHLMDHEYRKFISPLSHSPHSQHSHQSSSSSSSSSTSSPYFSPIAISPRISPSSSSPVLSMMDPSISSDVSSTCCMSPSFQSFHNNHTPVSTNIKESIILRLLNLFEQDTTRPYFERCVHFTSTVLIHAIRLEWKQVIIDIVRTNPQSVTDKCWKSAFEYGVRDLSILDTLAQGKYFYFEAISSLVQLPNIAAKKGRLDLLTWLHQNKFKLGRATADYAAEAGHLDCLVFLLETANSEYNRAYDLAVQNNHIQIIFYLEHSYNALPTHSTIQNACNNNNINLIQNLLSKLQLIQSNQTINNQQNNQQQLQKKGITFKGLIKKTFKSSSSSSSSTLKPNRISLVEGDFRWVEIATQKGHYQLLQYLLNNGNGIPLFEMNSSIPLGSLWNHAASVGDLESMSVLKPFLAQQDYKSQNPRAMYLAASNGHDKCLIFANESNLESNNDQSYIISTFEKSLESLNIDCIKYLLNQFSRETISMIDISVMVDCKDSKKILEILRLLSQFLSDEQMKKIPISIIVGSLEIFKYIEVYYPQLLIDSTEFLDLAAMSNRLDVLEYIIYQNKRHNWRCTTNALIVAAKRGYIGVVKCLFTLLSEHEFSRKLKKTCLLGAIGNGHEKTTKFLLDHFGMGLDICDVCELIKHCCKTYQTNLLDILTHHLWKYVGCGVDGMRLEWDEELGGQFCRHFPTLLYMLDHFQSVSVFERYFLDFIRSGSDMEVDVFALVYERMEITLPSRNGLQILAEAVSFNRSELLVYLLKKVNLPLTDHFKSYIHSILDKNQKDTNSSKILENFIKLNNL